jgi:hypothetical protein
VNGPFGSKLGGGDMGFYSASDLWAQDDGPIITSREYLALFANALFMVTAGAAHQPDAYRCGPADVATISRRLAQLAAQARRHPDDPTAKRRLGIAHLSAGNRALAVHYLQVAVNMLRARLTTGGFVQGSLCARLELALVLPALLPLWLRLGQHDAARRLVSDVLLAR